MVLYFGFPVGPNLAAQVGIYRLHEMASVLVHRTPEKPIQDTANQYLGKSKSTNIKDTINHNSSIR